jgi:hypothetical protein
MVQAFSDNPLHSAWPFWALELTPRCATLDIERAARDIQARLTMKLKGADEFAMPGGSGQRDEFLVREARARLLDPAKRLLCEFWYVSPQAGTEAMAEVPARYSAQEWMAMLERTSCRP